MWSHHPRLHRLSPHRLTLPVSRAIACVPSVASAAAARFVPGGNSAQKTVLPRDRVLCRLRRLATHERGSEDPVNARGSSRRGLTAIYLVEQSVDRIASHRLDRLVDRRQRGG